jgi:hypothetical protein
MGKKGKITWNDVKSMISEPADKAFQIDIPMD